MCVPRALTEESYVYTVLGQMHMRTDAVTLDAQQIKKSRQVTHDDVAALRITG